MIKNKISLYIATFLIIGFFFLAFPENGYSGFSLNGVCCQYVLAGDGDFCMDVPDGANCPVIKAGMLEDVIEGGSCNENTGLCINPVVNSSVPTISELGLIAMAVILGIIGYMVIRRRKVSA